MLARKDVCGQDRDQQYLVTGLSTSGAKVSSTVSGRRRQKHAGLSAAGGGHRQPQSRAKPRRGRRTIGRPASRAAQRRRSRAAAEANAATRLDGAKRDRDRADFIAALRARAASGAHDLRDDTATCRLTVTTDDRQEYIPVTTRRPMSRGSGRGEPVRSRRQGCAGGRCVVNYPLSARHGTAPFSTVARRTRRVRLFVDRRRHRVASGKCTARADPDGNRSRAPAPPLGCGRRVWTGDQTRRARLAKIDAFVYCARRAASASSAMFIDNSFEVEDGLGAIET